VEKVFLQCDRGPVGTVVGFCLPGFRENLRIPPVGLSASGLSPFVFHFFSPQDQEGGFFIFLLKKM